MKKVEKSFKLKDKFKIIKDDIKRRREKRSIDAGSIIYYEEDDRVGVCLSKNKYVTLEDSLVNPKVIVDEIFPSTEYYIGSINKDIFTSDSLKKIVENTIGEDNILSFKYKNCVDYVGKQVSRDKNKTLICKDLVSLKEKLKQNYGINKWYSSFTNLSVKELEDEIEEKKEELEKKKEDLKNEIINEKLTEIPEITEEDKEKIQKEMEKLFDKNNFEKNKEKIEELAQEFNKKENFEEIQNINLEIEKLLKELEKEQKKEIEESIKTTSALEQNMKSMVQNFENNSNEEDFKELGELLPELENLYEEIKDENIKGIGEIKVFLNRLRSINREFTENKSMMRGWDLSLSELKKLPRDFFNLISQYENNVRLKQFIDKIGRNISNEKKENVSSEEIKELINEFSKEEILGVELGNDLMRVLPSELAYLSEEEFEDIFYMKYSENKLLCYSLIGKEKQSIEKEKEEKTSYEEKGAIVALLDTSGSMYGYPIDNARAVLLQAFRIAKVDKRDMKVILFGSIGQTQEYTVESTYDINRFINFICTGYNGGTDFETPLKRAIDIVTKEKSYKFADIFMLTDGQCGVSSKLANEVKNAKNKLDLKLYTCIFGGYSYGSIDNYSDEVFNL